MTQSDLQTILQKLEENRLEREDQHEQFKNSLATITAKLDPVYKIYSQFSGFGMVAMGFFKFVVIPVSVIMGIWLSIKSLFH